MKEWHFLDQFTHHAVCCPAFRHESCVRGMLTAWRVAVHGKSMQRSFDSR